MIHGSTSGLKSSQVKALEKIYQRRLPAGEVITPELARYLTEQSRELRRQIGLIIDRGGVVKYVVLGDDAVFQNRFLDEPNRQLALRLVNWLGFQ